MLIFTSLNESATIAGIKLEGDVLERAAVYIEEMGVQFAQKINIVHRKTVFQILIRIMRLVPVDTGRLRGSFTTFLAARGFNKFMQYAETPAIAGGPDRQTPRKGFSMRSFEEGADAGDYVDSYLNTWIGTNVIYAGYVDERTSFLTRALIWGDKRYRSNMEAFLEATARKEAVTDPIRSDDDGQGGF